MVKKMLIDAGHPEETRVVVLNGRRIEEFDFESATKKPLRGNIYLAKIARVEPSLQAAFVEYGGNRRGFLAFSEIHPDYYQIPIADRKALLQAQREEDTEAEDSFLPLTIKDDDNLKEGECDKPYGDADGGDIDNVKEHAETTEGDASASDAKQNDHPYITENRLDIETAGSDDVMEEEMERRKPRTFSRRYKIQEVIKRGQIILIQVVKEERGTKGAALTTYLSLAGRYCVLMPNTARGGGISRKISDFSDRKRLKQAADAVELPEGMGLIIRTAGAKCTKMEIKRDANYLIKLWNNVRSLTLSSSAPTLIYEEGDLIRRTIRDLYNKDIGSILVQNEETYKDVKNFVKMLIPSHVKNVQFYQEPKPLFQRYQIESQLDMLLSPTIPLKSGGYLVISPTEALISIDVNSGRDMREYSIERTALQTNLEAATEITRQLRLRDLAGLIVIDFIDMMENKNNRAVEHRLKECLRSDRARIQVGRISPFGLLEMSRQRMRVGIMESSTETCPTCDGMGVVRSVESATIKLLRDLESMGSKTSVQKLTAHTSLDVASYILNQKRYELNALEKKLDINIIVTADNTITDREPIIETSDGKRSSKKQETAISMDNVILPSEEGDDANGINDDEVEAKQDNPPRTQRTQRSSEGSDHTAESPDYEGSEEGSKSPKRHSRRRGGRRNNRKSTDSDSGQDNTPETSSKDTKKENLASKDTTVEVQAV
ncbi:MAG: Rne/Rng family ribonuclease [Parvularculales bacterium]